MDTARRPARGTASARSTMHSDIKQQTDSRKASGSSRPRRKGPDQQHKHDVVLIDVSDSERHSDAAESEDETPQQCKGRRSTAAAHKELVISDSEASSEHEDSKDAQEGLLSTQKQSKRQARPPVRLREEDSSSSSSEDDRDDSDSEQASPSERENDDAAAAVDMMQTDSDSEKCASGSSGGNDSENEPFQSTRVPQVAVAAAASKRQAALGSSTPPRRRGRPSAVAAAPAEATPRRSTRKAATDHVTPCSTRKAATARSTRKGAAAEVAATPQLTRGAAAAATLHSTRGMPGAAAAPPAAATVTPSGRPIRTCTKAPKAAETPSLATPLGKLSLRSVATPKQSIGKQLHSAAAAAAAAPSSSKRGRKPRGGSISAVADAAVGDVLECVEVEGEVFGPGDDVYLALDGFDHQDDEEEACEVCGSSNCRRGNALLECSTCLRGFHLRCLSPPLKSVPEGDWLCSDCNAGHMPPPPAKLVTRWQKLLYGKDQLVLVHIVACQRGKAPDGTEEDQLHVRYYLLPQQTHVGRQQEHNARELFLGSKTFAEPAQAVVGHAFVRHPSRFAEVQDEEGNDVYLCEYEYDEDWKRFRARRYGKDGRALPSAHRLDHDDLGAACPAMPGERLLSTLAGAWGAAQRGGLHEEFGSDASGRPGDSGSDFGSDQDSEEGEEDYRPDYALQLRGAGGAVKRKRHGKLPAAALAPDRFAGLGATSIEQQRAQHKDAFAALHAALSLAAVPASLPCRDDERTRLQGFVGRALHEDGGVLYICGVPGTGKTALVMEVLGSMREEARETGAQFVAINCLQLPSPQHVFSRLWEKLSGQHLGPARARDALMQLFHVAAAGGAARRRYSTIIVLDEIDMLMTRDQAVLYQLFDWPNQPGSRLAVIGISNTHDLDQRVLPRIASRLDQAKLAFGPYSISQLTTIAQGRLDASGVGGAVEEQAVQWACRKVASETGDIRRALEALRRAVEIARQKHLKDLAANGKTGAAAAAIGGASSSLQQQAALEVQWKEGDKPLVLRGYVREALNEMFSALHHQLLRSRSMWEKVVLVSVVVEARATGRSAVVIQSVCERAANSIAALVDLTPPTLGVLQHCLVKLAGVRLLLSDGTHIKAHVALNVDKDDVALAIKEDVRLQRLHQLL